MEGVSEGFLLRQMRRGTIVVPANCLHRMKRPCAIGEGVRTKVNANLGTSTDKGSIRTELHKLAVALQCGADTVMDLSVGGNLATIRNALIAASPVPVGTVPVYEVAVNAQRRHRDPLAFSGKEVLEVLEQQAAAGVDFFTVHAGVTRASLEALARKRRLLGVVSRGGALLAGWMRRSKKENPFFELFDRMLEIARAYGVTLSLGDGLRPGSVCDATDPGQLAELRTLGRLAARARAQGVQVMIEGPGHVPLDQIERNVAMEKKWCAGAPFYILGPLVTDIASGYDHISAAIGGAVAASYGADFLCYVTPAEHLRHPSLSDVREGVIAARIAAHAADITKDAPGAMEWDRRMSLERRRRNWKKQIMLSVDPQKAAAYRSSSRPRDPDVCTMCGSFCSIKLGEQCQIR